jgi:hypothetical protein
MITTQFSLGAVKTVSSCVCISCFKQTDAIQLFKLQTSRSRNTTMEQKALNTWTTVHESLVVASSNTAYFEHCCYTAGHNQTDEDETLVRVTAADPTSLEVKRQLRRRAKPSDMCVSPPSFVSLYHPHLLQHSFSTITIIASSLFHSVRYNFSNFILAYLFKCYSCTQLRVRRSPDDANS